MDLYSAVCAVQNLWLAARAEGIGVGWVSILRREDLRAALHIPEDIELIAYLCVGYVDHFPAKPELESTGWLPRTTLRDIVWFDRWRQRSGERSEEHTSELQSPCNFVCRLLLEKKQGSFGDGTQPSPPISAAGRGGIWVRV